MSNSFDSERSSRRTRRTQETQASKTNTVKEGGRPVRRTARLSVQNESNVTEKQQASRYRHNPALRDSASSKRINSQTLPQSSTKAKPSSRPQRTALNSASVRSRTDIKDSIIKSNKNAVDTSRRKSTETGKQQHASSRKSHSRASAKNRPKTIKIVLAVIIVLLVFIGIDTARYWNKAYAGVTIAGVDVSGMTAEEIQIVIHENFEEKLINTPVEIYASEDAYQRVLAGENPESENAQWLSVEQAREQRLMWLFDATTQNAKLDSITTAQLALAVGRSDGGILGRLQALIFGRDLLPELSFEGEAYDSFLNEIDATIGIERIDCDIVIEDGYASATDGQDGKLVDRDKFYNLLRTCIFVSEEEKPYIVAIAEDAPMRISYEEASVVSDAVNATIAEGVVFVYEGSGWQATRSMLGSWISTNIVEDSTGWHLCPYILVDSAKPVVLNHLKQIYSGETINVSFSVEEDAITVHTDSTGLIPLVDDALNELNNLLFGDHTNFAHSTETSESTEAPQINISSTQVSPEMSFEEALDCGVITCIESYETTYTTGGDTANRNFNIHLAADLLNNSVCSKQGGEWSFHETAGECNEANGFKPAGIILDGEYIDEFGGGICQVATTVFNAVYEAGYHVVYRYNHSLYNANYPDGRDAAVSWPDLDFRWRNDTDSDILIKTSHTDSTVTVSLYGVDPEYTVETETGEWQKGEEYETKYIVDDTLQPKETVVKSKGSDGRIIDIVRHVYDKNGSLVETQRFHSNYHPKQEIIRCGTEFEIPEEDDEDKKSE